MKIDFRKTINCFNCDVSVEGGEEYTLKFQASDVEAEVKIVKRARNEKGQLQADDPSTPDVNEAWEGGEAPKKKTTAKKKTTKKTTKKASS